MLTSYDTSSEAVVSLEGEGASGGFTKVKAPRRRKNRNGNNGFRRFVYKQRTVEDHIAHLEKAKSQLSTSSFTTTVRGIVEYIARFNRISCIRCLALGKPTSTEPAMYQLALLLLLIDLFELSPSQVSAWDPEFEEKDLELMSRLGINVVPETGYIDPTITFYYLPHAPASLIDSVLSGRYSPAMMSQELLGAPTSSPKTESQQVDGSSTPVWMLTNRVLDYSIEVAGKREISQNYPALTRVIEGVKSVSASKISLEEDHYDTEWISYDVENKHSRNQPWWLAFNDFSLLRHISS